jgi:hypothetical protein
MKRQALFICSLLLFGGPLFAFFSAFERITPSSEESEHHPKVKFEKSGENDYLVSISNVGKHAWFVVCTEERKQNKREFREVIWKTPGAKSDDIELVVPLRLGEDRASQVQISDEFISRSYIVIDFPVPVFDGGFYYTIDIPEFHRNLNN